MASDSDLGQRTYSNRDGDDGCTWVKKVGANDATIGADAAFQEKVDSDGNSHAEVHGNKPDGSSDVALRLAENGAVIPDGVYDAVNNTDPGNVGLVGMARNATPIDGHQALRITAKENSDTSVRALDVALRDENAEPYTRTNPLPVVIEESEGSEKHDQNTVEDLATAATSNHDYSVPDGNTFYLKGILAAASGDASYDLLIGDGAVAEAFTRLHKSFSTPSKNGDIDIAKIPKAVVGTVNTTTIRIIRKNMDNKQMDVHTTILGVQF